MAQPPHSNLPTVYPSVAPPGRAVLLSSYLLMAAALLLVMVQGLLPGLLCACLGFLLTRKLSELLNRLDRRAPAVIPRRWSQVIAATLIGLAPLLLLTSALSHTRGYVMEAPQQYRELLDYLANKAGMLASTGKVWLAGLLHAYVGLLIGLLAAVRPRLEPIAPLTRTLLQRVRLLGEAFRQIVAAQFWIALFNTTLTALFLLLVLPWWEMALPYTPALIGLTFVAGLIPIVGNLFCNLVLTLVGLSVSPTAAAACLGFLILIHKAEYVINAKVVGQRTHMAVWELLSVMFVAESVFGPAGLVAAPLMYAYLKKELEAAHLV